MSGQKNRQTEQQNAKFRQALSLNQNSQSQWPGYQQSIDYYSSFSNTGFNNHAEYGNSNYGYPSNYGYNNYSQSQYGSYPPPPPLPNQPSNAYTQYGGGYSNQYGGYSDSNPYYDPRNQANAYGPQNFGYYDNGRDYHNNGFYDRRLISQYNQGRPPRRRSPPPGGSEQNPNSTYSQIKQMLEDQLHEICPNDNPTEEQLTECFCCGGLGHFARDCTRPRMDGDKRKIVAAVLNKMKEKYGYGREYTYSRDFDHRSFDNYPRRDFRGNDARFSAFARCRNSYESDYGRRNGRNFDSRPPRYDSPRNPPRIDAREKRALKRHEREREDSATFESSNELGLKILLDKICEGDQQMVEMKKLAEEKKLTEDMTTLCYKCAGMGHVKKDCTYEGEPVTREELKKMRYLKKALHRINGTSNNEKNFRLEPRDPFCSQLRYVSSDGIDITEEMLTICHKCARLGHMQRECKQRTSSSMNKVESMKRYLNEFRKFQKEGRTLRSLFEEYEVPYINLVNIDKDIKDTMRSIITKIALDAGDYVAPPEILDDSVKKEKDKFKKKRQAEKRKAEQEVPLEISRKATKSIYEDFAKQMAEMEANWLQEQEMSNGEDASEIQEQEMSNEEDVSKIQEQEMSNSGDASEIQETLFESESES